MTKKEDKEGDEKCEGKVRKRKRSMIKILYSRWQKKEEDDEKCEGKVRKIRKRTRWQYFWRNCVPCGAYPNIRSGPVKIRISLAESLFEIRLPDLNIGLYNNLSSKSYEYYKITERMKPKQTKFLELLLQKWSNPGLLYSWLTPCGILIQYTTHKTCSFRIRI